MVYLLCHSCGKFALPWQRKGNNPVIVFAPIMTLWSWLHRDSGSVSVNDHWIDACTLCFFCVQGVLALLCPSLLLKTLTYAYGIAVGHKKCFVTYNLLFQISLFASGIVGSNPAEGMIVSCECCVLWGRVLCVGLITRLEESYRVWCVQSVWSRCFVRGGHDPESDRRATGEREREGGGRERRRKRKNSRVKVPVFVTEGSETKYLQVTWIWTIPNVPLVHGVRHQVYIHTYITLTTPLISKTDFSNRNIIFNLFLYISFWICVFFF